MNRDSTRQKSRPPELWALLDRLGAGPEQAASEYEHLRRKLIKYFGWEQCGCPEDLADECLDRVARKLEDGLEVRNLSSYLAGVARIVAKEDQGRKRRELVVIGEFYRRRPARGPTEDLNAAVEDLDACLDKFSSEHRDLILRYYQGDHAERIQNRKILALKLGLLPNALRNRAMRLRTLLEACMAARMGQRDRTRDSHTEE